MCSLAGGTIAEMLRGIRLYFHKLVSGLTAPAAAQAQLGLGHSYSRAKVKFNVHRSDNMIIQSISLLDQLDKDINTFSMRIRWVGIDGSTCPSLVEGTGGSSITCLFFFLQRVVFLPFSRADKNCSR